MVRKRAAECDGAARQPARKAKNDPLAGPFLRVDDLAELGFGERKALYDAVKRGDIPSTRLGRKVLVPTSWALEAMGLKPSAT